MKMSLKTPKILTKMKVEVKNNEITIVLPLAPKASKTGKSIIIAGTGGFVGTTATWQGQSVKITNRTEAAVHNTIIK